VHEFALAEAVIAAALEAADREGLARITRIDVRIGELQRIEREVFDFALQEVLPAEEPRLAATRIAVEAEAARFRCRPCGRCFELADTSGPGGVDAGEDMRVSGVDPRFSVIDRRLEGVGRIVAVTGGKGGIGKSLVASTLALALADAGRRVGLLDLDLTGASAHVVLGIDPAFPSEQFGVEPSVFHGIRFMSIVCFAGSEPAPLRGEDLTHALLELLAITRWGELDFLIVDMPPGLGDVALDAARLLRRAEHLALATPSRVALATVRKNLRLLARLGVPVAGLVENMARSPVSAVHDLATELGVRFLGSLPFDAELEAASGDVERLRGTAVVSAIRALAHELADARGA
jgi:ATP-binding protein involved in chromosome partitioning